MIDKAIYNAAGALYRVLLLGYRQHWLLNIDFTCQCVHGLKLAGELTWGLGWQGIAFPTGESSLHCLEMQAAIDHGGQQHQLRLLGLIHGRKY
jgi:hypothetical protein